MKNKTSFFLFINFLLLAHSSSAENTSISRIDSLIQKLSVSKEDTNKIKLYDQILYFFISQNSEEGLKYTQPALELSQKLNWGVITTKMQIGRIYWKLGKMDMALKYHFDALKMAENQNATSTIARLNVIIGQDYGDGGNYPEALKYFLKAKEIYLKAGDKEQLSGLYLIISWVYDMQGNYPESSRLNMEALRAFELLKDDYGAAVASANLAGDFLKLDKDKEAIPYILKASENFLKTNDFINLSANYVLLADAYTNLKNYPKAVKAASLAHEYGKKINDKTCMGEAQSKKAEIQILQNNFSDAVAGFKSAIQNYLLVNANHLVAEKYSKLSICYIRLHQPDLAKSALDSAEHYGKQLDTRALLTDYLYSKQLYDSLRGNWKNAYFNHYKYISIRDSIYNAENTKKILRNQVQYDFDKKEAAEKAEQEKKDALAKAEIKKQKIIRNSITVGLAAVVMFLIVVYRQRNKISKARKLSDELLLNILPEEVAEELKEKGSADAKQFDEVTVMFTDFKGFTQISEKLSPQELVSEIDSCFKAFDNIITKYGIEKIKTIGDSYMCAGGLPVANNTHAEDVVRAALEIQQFMQQHLLERKNTGKEIFEIRIGVHTGSVVAGIVGVKKFAYDIWGDTVNIASRMESSGEAGKVNVSGTTYELVKNKFNCEYRGEIEAKGKGKVRMYFVKASYNQV